MSNKVGELYNIIIENVIKETKTEFEESGEDPAVLDMLKKTWKDRLLSMNVTKTPLWDNSSKAPNASSATGQIPHAIPGTVPGSLGVSIGPQDGYHGSDSLGRLYNTNTVKDIGGPGASNELRSVEDSSVQIPGGEGPGGRQSFVKEEAFDVSTIPGGGNNPSSAMLQGNISAFNPLDSSKVNTNNSTSPRQMDAHLSPELRDQIHNAMNSNNPIVPQSDGPQDEELNSDLDDSEDELNSNDEDEDNEQTQIMLCLYEKVHKVKTRWKYTLKDGVANVNGLDYVFARATGESEW